MPIPVQQFPILQPGQMSPWHQALQQGLENYSAINKAAYEPIKTMAQATSQMAYANLMGPQFLAKVLGNENLLANLDPAQRQAALNLVYQAGGGQVWGNPNMGAGQPSKIEKMVDFVKNAFKFGDHAQPRQQELPTQDVDMSNLSPQDKQQMAQMKPGDAYTIQGLGADRGYSYDRNGHNVVASPEEINKQFPVGDAVENAPTSPSTRSKSFAENAGEFAGIKAEGTERGKARAKAIAELGEDYKSAVQAQIPLDNAFKIADTPAFQNLRRFPFWQQKQLNVLSKAGTPAEQDMIAEFLSNTRIAVAELVKSFKGRALQKEFDVANGIKISGDDTWPSIVGKYTALKQISEMTQQRDRITANLMRTKHIDQDEAIDQADRYIDADKIRENIRKKFENEQISLVNPDTGERKSFTRKEARAMGVPNV